MCSYKRSENEMKRFSAENAFDDEKRLKRQSAHGRRRHAACINSCTFFFAYFELYCITCVFFFYLSYTRGYRFAAIDYFKVRLGVSHARVPVCHD